MCSILRIRPEINVSLCYVRTRDGKEVDFALCKEDRIVSLIEVKLTENRPSPGLPYFHEKIPEADAFQLVQNLRQEKNMLKKFRLFLPAAGYRNWRHDNFCPMQF